MASQFQELGSREWEQTDPGVETLSLIIVGFYLLVQGVIIGIRTLCKRITEKVTTEIPLLESQLARKGTKEYFLHLLRSFHCKNPSLPILSLKKLQKMHLSPFPMETEGRSDSADCN